MSKEAMLMMKIPMCNTKEIHIRDLVIRGSIYCQNINCVSTAWVNRIGEEVKKVVEDVEVGMQIFVDDIDNASKETANTKRAMRNCRELEDQKNFTIGLEKTKYMIIDADQNNSPDTTKSTGI